MRTIRYILVTGALLGLLSACDMPQKPEADKLDAGKVLVSIQIANEYATAAARSVLPQIALDDVDHFALWGAPVGTTETELIPSFTQGASTSVNAGTWDFTVRGYGGVGDLILQGELKGQSVSGMSNSFSFSVAPLLEGTGSIAITITLPSGSGVTTAAVFKDGEAETSLPVTANRVTYSVDSIAAGNYFYSFRLNNTAGYTIAVVSQVVQVRAHLRSEKTIAVSRANLNVLPDTPAAPLIEAGDGQLTVNWEPVSMVGDYEVYYSETSIPPVELAQTLSDTTSAVISGLANGTTYYVWVKAKNAAGTSDYSPAASGTTLPLDTPEQPTVTVGDRQFTLTWNAVPRANSYEVYYNVASTPPDTPAQTLSNITTTVISGLANGTTYYVWVKSKNAAGTSDYSPGATGMPLGIPTVTASDDTLTVSWDAVAGADEYDVYCGISTALPDIPIQTGISGTSTVITNLANGIYYIWVQVKNAYDTTTSPYALVVMRLLLPPVWYVSSTGNDTNNGLTPETALATVKKALAYTQVEYSNGHYPIVEGVPETTSIVISGTITQTATTNGMIEITGTNTYPPLELRGKSSTEQGTLNANQQNRVLYIGSGNNVTLGEHLIITGGKVSGVFDFRRGGGVYNGGTFIMSGGEISGNSVDNGGGGVCNGGTFTMSGGEISGNSGGAGSGGGVYNHGAFTMSNGTISGNSSPHGGGVYNGGTFIMSGGEISGNFGSGSFAYGGGVYNESTFTMSGGEISGNAASYLGGGVFNSSTFTMSGGEISGNALLNYTDDNGGGGGVYHTGSSFFKKTGGIIYGDTDGDIDSKKNTVRNGNGHAVYAGSSKQRNSTAGEGVTLDSAIEGSAGGWE